jgi:F0F1-type ATP synthase assembly protein I
MSEKEKPKYGKLIEGAEQLSLGISIVVAILIGIGLGMLMSDWFNTPWLLWVGVSLGSLITGMKNLWNKTHKVVSFYSTPTKLKRVRCTNTASTDQMETGRNIVIPMDLRWN